LPFSRRLALRSKGGTITVDWFHAVKLFTDALEKKRRSEQRQDGFPESIAGPC
jgi:hypothetical protein